MVGIAACLRNPSQALCVVCLLRDLEAPHADDFHDLSIEEDDGFVDGDGQCIVGRYGSSSELRYLYMWSNTPSHGVRILKNVGSKGCRKGLRVCVRSLSHVQDAETEKLGARCRSVDTSARSAVVAGSYRTSCFGRQFHDLLSSRLKPTLPTLLSPKMATIVHSIMKPCIVQKLAR